MIHLVLSPPGWPRLLAAAVLALGASACTDPGDPEQPVRVGLITNNPNGLRNLQGFRDGLAELGRVDGRGIAYVQPPGPVPGPRLRGEIGSMIDAGVALVFTAGTPTGVAAHEVTRSRPVPVVFGVVADPVRAGILTDLQRPGGNLTGVKLSENQAGRLDLLVRAAPGIERVWVAYNPGDSAPASAVEQISKVASGLGVTLVTAEVHSDDDVTAALASMPPDVDAVFMVPDSTVNRRVADLIELTNRRRLPVSGPSRIQVERGALMSYGFSHHAVGAQAARIAHRVLNGDDPATIPVEDADYFLAVNLAAAKRIGLTVPDDLVQQADDILYSDALAR